MSRMFVYKAWCGAALCLSLGAHAQPAAVPAVAPAPGGSPVPPTAQGSGSPPVSASVRFLEACNQSLEKGVTDLGCQGPLYRNELERLKREAVTTQNPQLLSLLGNAYENPRAGLGDVGQAYRWYLMAAVRGDPRAMQRLSEMNRRGSGVPQDKVKALGYARLAQRLGAPGATAAAPDVAQAINDLGSEMAAEEMALAERFALELEAQVLRQTPNAPQAPTGAPLTSAPAPALPAAAPSLPGRSLPGVPQSSSGPTAPLPGARLPGIPASP